MKLTLVVIAVLLFAGANAGDSGLNLKTPTQDVAEGALGAQCHEQLKPDIEACQRESRQKNQEGPIALSLLSARNLGELERQFCAVHLGVIECINDAACGKCKYAQAQAFAAWYDKQVAHMAMRGCKETPLKAKCQLTLVEGRPNKGLGWMEFIARNAGQVNSTDVFAEQGEEIDEEEY